jgi:hypothetical protein
MALYVTMLTRPAFVALEKEHRVQILKQVFFGIGDRVPDELKLGDVHSILRDNWALWKKKSSLTGNLRQLQPTQFADVVLCLLSCAGLRVVVGDPSHDVVTTGLAYVTLAPEDDDVPPKGHATFVEVGVPSSTSYEACGLRALLTLVWGWPTKMIPGLCDLRCVSSPSCWTLRLRWRRKTLMEGIRCSSTRTWRFPWCLGAQGQLSGTCMTQPLWPCCLGWVSWALASEMLWTT